MECATVHKSLLENTDTKEFLLHTAAADALATRDAGKLTFKSEGKHISIPYTEIYYFEMDSHTITIHAESGTYQYRITIGEPEKYCLRFLRWLLGLA